MTTEDKELLLKDLCARLPYGVKLRYVEDLVVKKESHVITLNNIYLEHIINGDADIKPYLRPISSMTEEERNEVTKYMLPMPGKNGKGVVGVYHRHLDDVVDFYNKHHFDYRGLIPMGLALEAPKDMYKTK